MDAQRFDRFTVDMAERPTRRTALRLLAAGLLGGLLAQRNVVTAFAQRPDRDGDGLYDDDEVEVYGTNPDVYDTDGDGVGDGEEVYVGTDPLTNPAPPPAPGCPAGQADCGAGCIDVSANPGNCGACGNACPAGDSCAGGFCQTPAPPPPAALTCAAGLHNCGTYCANVSQDAANCGICGWDCGSRDLYFCYLGMCVGYCEYPTRRCTGEYHCRPYTEACPA